MTILHLAGRSLAALPRAVGSAIRGRALPHSVLSGVVGLLAWFLAFLAVLGSIRGLLYPLVGGEYSNAWGGPTLAGAWAVHALIALVLAPVIVAVIAALGVFQDRLRSRMLDRTGPSWPVPVAVILTIAGALFFVSWLRQV